ncbi:MAG: hypothetical protein JNK32_04755 [Anaerolineales bacterium]|nr:hypothetical protein [Anaerolineales bacterium]
MKKRTIFILISLMVMLSLILSACGEEDYGEETYTEEDVATEEFTGEEAAVEEPAAEEPPSDVPANAGTPGEVIYDFGFNPVDNGFSFQNYGDDIPATNLTSYEMWRMFGDVVCADINGDECILTPPAEQWMEQINGSMAGGHCEGMAVLSLMMYTGQVSPSDFGGSIASDLNVEDEALQREIAYWWATQAVDPTVSAVIKGTPMEILETIRQMDVNGETYTIGIYNDRGEGHAITPFGVEDKGDGLYAILVYDNNYPGETRELYIDSRDGSWTYETSINPEVATDVWSGNADTQTLDLTPTSARLETQYCSFCEGGLSSISGKLAAPTEPYNQVFLDGEGHILITDDSGNRLGYVDGQIVNEIPGASYAKYRMAASMNTPEPIYSVPVGLDLTITVDGTELTEETLTDLMLIGPGYSIGVEGIYLAPGQVDVAYFYPADEMIAYETTSDESPSIIFGVENPDADYYFEVYGADMIGGGIITAWLDSAAGDLLINTEKLTGEGNFNLYMTRITDEVEEEFYAEDIILNEGALIYINYAEWTDANPEGIYFGVDLNGDGEIDEEYVVDDTQ